MQEHVRCTVNVYQFSILFKQKDLINNVLVVFQWLIP